jgi:hypothetical protein
MRDSCVHRLLIIGLFLTTAGLLTGCGVSIPAGAAGDTDSLNARFVLGETDSGEVAVIVLNWSAGDNSLYPQRPMDAIDLSTFETDGGHTLAEHEGWFKEQVRSRVEIILNDIDLFPVVVVNDDDDWEVIETTVHLTQEIAPDGSMEIGRAYYDPCNEHRDDEAVIFGERIRRLGNGYAFDEWVNVFANVCAHETAHTFGFGHILRSDQPPTKQAPYVELMLDGFTMSDMRRQHRMIVSQPSCPDEKELIAERTLAATAPCRCERRPH